MLDEVIAGRFRITELLGSGGVGQVWSAQDERMRRDVAVKIVSPHYFRDEAETQARFEREVRLAGQLLHQNIVTVHDWGEVVLDDRRRTLYLVMELVRGVGLDKRLKEPTPTSWLLAVGWAVQIAQALDAAHRQEIVHRDIKPENVLLTPEGTVKVLDFGVAKFMGETRTARNLTVTGKWLGSVNYMSPEQAWGVRKIDHRTDLYSLGCLLYHAVTGRPPFISDVELAVLRMHMEDTPVAPATRVEGLPAALDDLILSLLAKNPEDRPQDAAAVRDALSTILVDQVVTLPADDILTLAQLGHAHSITGRILHKSWELWQETERHSAARRDAADSQAAAVLVGARAEAEKLVTEALRQAEETLADARRTAAEESAAQLAEAARTAEDVLDKASVEARSTTETAVAEAARIRAEAERWAEQVRAEARRAAEEAPGAEEPGPRDRHDRPRDNGVSQGVENLSAAMDDLERWFRERTKNTPDPQSSAEPHDTELGRTALRNREIELKADDLTKMLDVERRHVESDLRLAKDARGDARPRGDRLTSQTADSQYSPYGFELVRRGYDRAQVDDRIAELVVMRDRSLSRIGMLETIVVDLLALYLRGEDSQSAEYSEQRLAAQLIAAAKHQAAQRLPYAGDPRGSVSDSSPYGFELVRRGYDRAQVDDRIGGLMSDLHRAKVQVGALAGLVEDVRRGRIPS
ncbi:serine/threonine-protein kinase [Streptomyces sp. NBC_00140]|uniref:serine/threonine-protein kinase n=1 Tax=Streptomyces sp. NBC_00140 TaxID=2975664 RepID=UPI00225A09B0|nr:serine/threonine-protein kinase [Streptomyces sp. NBC_00140]MCX5332343.1 protein kinase [Streptomyces sp. NBC_00140]